MPNTRLPKRLSHLIDKTEQELQKIQNNLMDFKKNGLHRIRTKDPSLNDKLDELTKLLQEINLTLNQKKATDCCKGHENPNLKTQQAMRDILMGKNVEIIENYSQFSDEVKKGSEY
ncbi:hypothetical protein [Helicobacter cetorum]|uniref:Uncharacterized protein n=1 Tax=Helicobacter cetorum (strain ATCC BAA-429 / MIT 00-7128) TaxID=182217 RepID=I0EMI8_HELC0|nr:hypothetical protein [Helicobacter cetorum]AFI04157.1 hypothetical protein HCW_04440 [Helicobacter cetorum MIT 00-7128]AFI04458.1 hypothetical protein HCW_05980 [Helicobacter cetorum MIT 00-7128]